VPLSPFKSVVSGKWTVITLMTSEMVISYKRLFIELDFPAYLPNQ